MRMIFCGSVGLHHVLATLRGDVHASQPVNDMPAVEIHPLQMQDAVQLTKDLMSLLAQYHYLIADDAKRYTFRFPLIRRWWLIAHGLNQGGR